MHSSNSSWKITANSVRDKIHIFRFSRRRNILEFYSNFPKDSFEYLLAGMRPRSRTTSAQRRLLFFKLCYRRGYVRPCGHRYITSCRWRTYDRYVRAGAGTSHECRDEVHTTIFDSFPLSHTSIVFPFSSLRSLLRTITCFAAGCHESRNPQNSAESTSVHFNIFIFSFPAN